MQRRVGHPQDTHQLHMLPHAMASIFKRSRNCLAAPDATALSRLQMRSALIAKHRTPPRHPKFCSLDNTFVRRKGFPGQSPVAQSSVFSFQVFSFGDALPGSEIDFIGMPNCVVRAVTFLLRTENREPRTAPQTKRPPGNLGGLFFQGRIVLTELLKTHQNFLRESYEP